MRTEAGGLIKCVCCGRVVPVPGYPIGAGESARCLGLYRPDVLEIVMKFLCPQCQCKLSIDVRWEGQTSKCPRCQEEVTAPSWSRAVESPETPPAFEWPARRPQITMLSPAEIEFLSGAGDDGPEDHVIEGRAL
jgi:hypothetical protein